MCISFVSFVFLALFEIKFCSSFRLKYFYSYSSIKKKKFRIYENLHLFFLFLLYFLLLFITYNHFETGKYFLNLITICLFLVKKLLCC